MDLLNYLLVSRNGGICKRPRAAATGTEMGLRAKSEKGVVDKVSKLRRFRRLMGTNELQRSLDVVNGGRDGFEGLRWGVTDERVTSILAGS